MRRLGKVYLVGDQYHEDGRGGLPSRVISIMNRVGEVYLVG